MVRNADIEMRWVNAWNDLADIVRDRRDVPCQLPDWSVIDAEGCRGWLQDSVYEGYHVRVEAGWVGHLRGVVAYRWRETDARSLYVCQSGRTLHGSPKIEPPAKTFMRDANSGQYDQIVASIANDVKNDQVLHLLNDIANSTESSDHFVRALIASQLSSGVREEEAVSEAMRILENIADESKPIGLALMKILFEYANELRMHDVCDSINLWTSS